MADHHPITAGIDVGAVSTKIVVLQNGSVLSSTVKTTGTNGAHTALRCFRAALKSASVSPRAVAAVVATGYGRRNVSIADFSVTEISCHSRGALHYSPHTDIIIDIGGQDTKAIFLQRGRIHDFYMNDKCAAGTGRFIEVMAKALQIPLERFGKEGLRGRPPKRPCTISSTCTVFAESEVISLLAQREPKKRIIRALHEAIVNRILSMAHQIPAGKRIMLTGGVAKNNGIVACFRSRLKKNRISLPSNPQIVGALGAALIACDRLQAGGGPIEALSPKNSRVTTVHLRH
jgi:predicted CoA-substrate-specific enzyme activase